MSWVQLSNEYWQRKTHRTTGCVFSSGGGYVWLVYTRHQPDLLQRVRRVGRGDNNSVHVAQALADEFIESPDPAVHIVNQASRVRSRGKNEI